MDILLRVIAILIEISVLAGIIYCFLLGVKLTVFDLGIEPKYRRVITMAMVLVGCIILVFFFAHLITFYPTL